MREGKLSQLKIDRSLGIYNHFFCGALFLLDATLLPVEVSCKIEVTSV